MCMSQYLGLQLLVWMHYYQLSCYFVCYSVGNRQELAKDMAVIGGSTVMTLSPSALEATNEYLQNVHLGLLRVYTHTHKRSGILQN